MTDKESVWDKLLQIESGGRDDGDSDEYRYPYEPTPYSVLERLADSGLFRKGDTLVDYGSGKGRVDFFIAHRTKARAIGIEYQERIFKKALENKKSAPSRSRVEFLHQCAEDYLPAKEVNRCYFFNPFSLEILRKVISRILDSYYEHPREILLFFYYPSDQYVAHLMTVDELEFYDEIPCQDLFEGNGQRERILVFALRGYKFSEEGGYEDC